MNVTVIPSDYTIICDDEAVRIKPWPFDDKHIHAIQWHHTEGEIEYRGLPRPANELFDDYSRIEPYVEAFNAAANATE